MDLVYNVNMSCVDKSVHRKTRVRAARVSAAAVGVVGMLVGGARPVGAVESYAVDIATPAQAAAIAQNCATIKQNLRTLQVADSRTRVLLGTTYQNVLANFITPLNLRLVKNNRPNTALTSLQSDFDKERQNFINQFVDYSKGLEELINTDCTGQPEDFYYKLQQVRTKRATLRSTVDKLNKAINTDITTVTKLKESW